MRDWLTGFCTGDSGAVTVDWVVLSAAVIGLGLLVLIPIAFSADSVSTRVGNFITDLDAGYLNQD